jgi:hypothetical protein
VILSVTAISLTGCLTTTPVTYVTVGEIVTVSECRHTWNTLSEDEKEMKLKEFEGCDIFTSQTLRDIKDNNDSIRTR